MFGREDEAKVAFLASAEVAFDGCGFCRQDLMGLLDGGIVRIVGLLG